VKENTSQAARSALVAISQHLSARTIEGLGIVEVMDHDRRTHVVLRDDVYRRLIGPALSESLAMPDGADIELPLPERK